MPEKNDQKLIKQYLKGDKKSLEILVKKYLRPIHNFVWQYVRNKQDAEEITQEVFVKTWRNLKKFDRTKNFKTWIFAIAKNAAIDFIRKKKTLPFSDFSAYGGSAFGGENADGKNFLAEKLIDPSPLPAEVCERASSIKTLNSKIEQLSLNYRQVLKLHHDNQLTFEEIAESLGKPINTVKSWHRRAVIQLKKLFIKP